MVIHFKSAIKHNMKYLLKINREKLVRKWLLLKIIKKMREAQTTVQIKWKKCVCFYRDEDRSVPQVLQALIQLNDQVHISVRYTGIKLIGELCDWLNTHPQYIGINSFFF